ncbi:MAG: 3-keto-disaccharide hydrolase [Vicinamibacterales bacterium]
MTRIVVTAILLASIGLVAQAPSTNLGYTDTPLLPGVPYRVHDSARPRPATVTPALRVGDAPSDATILFDGTDLSSWAPTKNGWRVENGYMEVVPNSGDLRTKETFGDVQLHVEWAAPAQVRGDSQNRGNSGIFLHRRYEVQVLDSFDNLTYPDGQAGALYGQWPPLVNAARRPGSWQSYDIVFEAPRFEGSRLIKPAYMTVFLNGVLLHNRKELMGPTVHRALASYAPQPAEDSLVLQDHQQPVRYRNIWIRRLGGYDR